MKETGKTLQTGRGGDSNASVTIVERDECTNIVESINARERAILIYQWYLLVNVNEGEDVHGILTLGEQSGLALDLYLSDVSSSSSSFSSPDDDDYDEEMDDPGPPAGQSFI
ncbi:unnamed protein product [Gongylonema pulchrum]|uniref:Uncharacterized protein n=1 Tax=Gongylonema pulchrum TaxID=637853 RepID=A0A183EMG2_9BILA|nr:unnamed protein product [Gongylonema pulchrum]